MSAAAAIVRLPIAGPRLPTIDSGASPRGLRRHQPPVRIARSDLAREAPVVGDLGDALRVAGDHLARLVAGRGDELALELHGDDGLAILELGLDYVGLADADEALVDHLPAPLAVG